MDGEICVIYRASAKAKDLLLALKIDDDKYRSSSFLRKIIMRLDLNIKINYRSSDEKFDRKVMHFCAVSAEKEICSFAYGDDELAPDDEPMALAKIIGKCASIGFCAERRAISLFSNRKIDQLILHKADA
ncbi:hypothetical protein [Novosphingobium colocasiae]|uniref:Uncharacterized protein n=1 Tax=Novosphingobium colocasiae TaxID=1256513 RepID=A0A918PGM3_9SPHN|nr:hypothetical protein [Novosphingobium colocasiae]GGZ08338.1 hypothetical protein GCM10011614_23980 [Novosphingobium colocasiae]